MLHGGAPGLRDLGLLQSALARPRHLAAYDGDAGACSLAAAYTCGIVQNDPFIDGNKRAGFVIGVLFLELNGGFFEASEADAAKMMIRLAAGALDEAGYRRFLAETSTLIGSDADIS